MNIEVRQITYEEFSDAYAVRKEVFVDEQGVPENVELDEYDTQAIHVVAYMDGKPIGCARMVEIDGSAKLGRFAVLKEHRGKGVGRLIYEKLLESLKEANLPYAYLHAQVKAVPFYKKLGFSVIGNTFMEDGIEHVKMEKYLTGVIIIGIAGGTGSGKSTLVKRLKAALQDEVITLTHDYYYKPHSDLTLEERKKLNYDHPNAFDTDELISDLKKLKKWIEIERPVYDYSLHTRAAETVRETPKKVVIVEGILIFEHEELRKLFDIKVFVDTDADVRILRRIIRDVKERGRDLDSVVNQYLNTVKPMHEEFVEPSKRYADIIVPEGGYNQVACSMLLHRILSLLNQE